MRKVFPMMADSCDKSKLDAYFTSDAYVAEEKFDGSRYILQITDGKVYLTSRRESVNGGMCEKSENVPHITRFKPLQKSIGTIIDGEIVSSAGNVGGVTSIMGSLPEKAIARQIEKGFVTYMAFDILSLLGRDVTKLPLLHRRMMLKAWVEKIKCPYIRLTEQVTKDKEAFYYEIVKKGGEGIMLKNLNCPYVEGERPKRNWIKVKKVFTYDGIVLGGNEGRGKYAGTLGALSIGQYVNGNLQEVATISGMTDEQRTAFWKDIKAGKKWVVEFEAQEKTKDFRYRHPQFKKVRTDKSFKDCTF